MKNIFKDERFLEGLRQTAVDGARFGGQILGAILLGMITDTASKNTRKHYRSFENYDYADAIDAIYASDMWSSDKREAVKFIRREETSVYYKAVIAIVESGTWSSDRLKSIKQISV